MKKLCLLFVCLSAVLLSACGTSLTEQEERQKVADECTMTGYVVFMSDLGNYFCWTPERARRYRFDDCSYSCDRAIDDNRDLQLQNATTETLDCMKFCMGE